MIRPPLEYGSVLFDNCSGTDSDLMESVQRRAAVVCTGSLRCTSTAKLMNEVGWDNLEVRRKKYKLTLFFTLSKVQAPV